MKCKFCDHFDGLGLYFSYCATKIVCNHCSRVIKDREGKVGSFLCQKERGYHIADFMWLNFNRVLKSPSNPKKIQPKIHIVKT